MGDHSTDLDKAGKYALQSDLYDVLNNVVKIGLPGAGTLYFTIAKIWGLPYAEEVIGSFAAVAVFLGIIITISKLSYSGSVKSNDGALVVDQSNPLKDSYSFEVTTPLEDLAMKDSITLKIKSPSQ